MTDLERDGKGPESPRWRDGWDQVPPSQRVLDILLHQSWRYDQKGTLIYRPAPEDCATAVSLLEAK